MRFHVLGLPHTATNKAYCACAFTGKVLRLCAMLHRCGHTVYHYGNGGSAVECTEHAQIADAGELAAAYPHDLTRQVRFDVTDEFHTNWYRRAICQVTARHEPRDVLLCSWGMGHAPVARAMPKETLIVEPGIGYVETFAPYRAFESYTWMHWRYGREGREDGAAFDAVIPCAFDVEDFECRATKGDYLLYLGRIISRKGVGVAVEVARRTGLRLVIAGQGSLHDPAEGIDLREEPAVEFVGPADVAKRRELMAGARALLAPTQYLEPFGGVAVEAMLSGTPVITTDWGAFAETVLHGVTGYRCRTLEQFAWAAEHADRIRAEDCRGWAERNYSTERVGDLYQAWFEQLSTLWGEGWYAPRPDRADLDWLRREYPAGACYDLLAS